jgi:oxygen-independent coproporphyrinogen-3 oxidase
LLYIHIPFCKQACNYCDFHFSTSIKYKSQVVEALVAELEIRKDYLAAPISSIYFGGGTPSRLTAGEVSSIFNAIHKNYKVNDNIEVTFESNPDDLTFNYLKEIKSLGINRLSIGIQSFREANLKSMNRAHTVQQAYDCLNFAESAGFSHISIDLIYGIQGLTNKDWVNQLDITKELPINHLSCYSLTVEPKTPLAKAIALGKVESISDDQSADQFEILQDWAANNGFEHYEISNLAKMGGIAQHNSAYWKGAHYLGIGPSAHSFNGTSRSINVPNNTKYMRAIASGKPEMEVEMIDEKIRFNELVLTGLRTKWGVSKKDLIMLGKKYVQHFQQQSLIYREKKIIKETDTAFMLHTKAWLNADGIAGKIFI